MYTNNSSNASVAGIHNTSAASTDREANQLLPGWPAESWDLTPNTTATAPVQSAANSGPVVVMLGLFTVCGECVSAVMLEDGTYVWLDLISRNGSRATPLAVVSGFDTDHPHAQIEAGHRHWAQRPEVRWHLAHQTAELYRAYLNDRRPAVRQPRPRFDTASSSCPEPRPRPRPAAETRSHATDTAEPGSEG